MSQGLVVAGGFRGWQMCCAACISCYPFGCLGFRVLGLACGVCDVSVRLVVSVHWCCGGRCAMIAKVDTIP